MLTEFNFFFHFSFTDLSRTQRTLSKSLGEFNFECIGSTQTDDEQVIVDSLKQFSKLIANIEDERDNMVSTGCFGAGMSDVQPIYGSFGANWLAEGRIK